MKSSISHNFALRFMSFLLAIGVLLQVHNSVVNGHYHLINNSGLVYHFHPLTAAERANNDGSLPIQSHNHTPEKLLIIFLYNTSLVSTVVFIAFFTNVSYFVAKRLLHLAINCIRLLKLHRIPVLRAPPRISFSY